MTPAGKLQSNLYLYLRLALKELCTSKLLSRSYITAVHHLNEVGDRENSSLKSQHQALRALLVAKHVHQVSIADILLSAYDATSGGHLICSSPS